MRYIVTGATGFIGFALCKELIKTENDVIAIVRPKSKNIKKLNNYINENPVCSSHINIIELELNEIGKLYKEYNIKADVFFHLAWNGSSGKDREDFDMQYSNVKFMIDAIKTAKACECQKIVGAGSQAEYGVCQHLNKEDEVVPHPFMMYGAAKLAAYEMGKIFAKQIDIGFVWPRMYSVYGVGENDGTLVSYVMSSLLNGDIPQLSPCENMWNYIYIDDCARVLRKLGESVHAMDGVYNVASEDTRLLKDFVREIRDIIDKKMSLNFGAHHSIPERTFWLEPDTTKIQNVAGSCCWTFEQGIREKLNDYSVHHNKKSTR